MTCRNTPFLVAGLAASCALGALAATAPAGVIVVVLIAGAVLAGAFLSQLPVRPGQVSLAPAGGHTVAAFLITTTTVLLGLPALRVGGIGLGDIALAATAAYALPAMRYQGIRLPFIVRLLSLVLTLLVAAHAFHNPQWATIDGLLFSLGILAAGAGTAWASGVLGRERLVSLILNGVLAAAVINSVVAFVDIATGSTLTSSAGFSGRAIGLAGHPNWLGFIAFWGILASLSSRYIAWRWRIPIGLLCAMAVVISGSRAAALAALILASVIVIKSRTTEATREGGKPIIVLGGIAAGLLASALLTAQFESSPATDSSIAYDQAMDRLTGGSGGTQGSDLQRLDKLEDSVQDIISSPVIGSGPKWQKFGHNIEIQLAQSYGIIGLILFATTVGAALRQDSAAVTLRSYGSALAVLLIGWLVIAQFQNLISERILFIPLTAALTPSRAPFKGRT